MATLREVRNRISGVRKTQKITRAMKMVAAAKLRRRQNAVVAARPYGRQMKTLLAHLSHAAGETETELITPREVTTIAVVVVTSDRGFCGAFNSNLIKTVLGHLVAQPAGIAQGKALKLYCIGKKGVEYFSKRGYNVVGRYVGVYSDLVFGRAQAIASEIIEGYRRGEFDRVDVVYNEFKTMAQSRIVLEQFLPVPRVNGGDGAQRPAEYIYEPNQRQILLSILPRHLHFLIWRILLESNAAEEGARMAAMENATENAQEMISTLQLQYNKARQAAITKELLEVVSGAEALRNAE